MLRIGVNGRACISESDASVYNHSVVNGDCSRSRLTGAL